ncbi:LysR family transcriptional regulator [Nocardia sp. R7R-8]|uniref:LysR family transcriptional regulator n=1 Tax=Nocardia sp. R7R-8 TaxID=3459304 RepID=UPI00403D7CEF
MEIQQLKCFIAVADELHFGRAAERLRLTASPVSRAVKELERELGSELFVRRYHSVELTEFGRELLAPARQVLDHLETMRELARRRAGIRTMTIGATHLVPHPLIDAVTDLVEEQIAAESSMTVVWGTSSELFPRVEQGEVDLAVVHLPTDRTALGFVEIARYTFVVIMRADDPLASAPVLRLSDLRSRKVIIQPESPQPLAMSRFHERLVSNGISDFVRLDDHDPGRLAAHVRHSHGITVSLSPHSGGAPKIFDDPAFAAVPLGENEIPFSAGVVWLRTALDESAPLRAVVEAIRRRWLESPDRY